MEFFNFEELHIKFYNLESKFESIEDVWILKFKSCNFENLKLDFVPFFKFPQIKYKCNEINR